jgi:putative oxidoreductase
MNERLQNVLALGARVLIAALFLPAGLAKLGGFEGTVGYIASVGLPLPQLGAVLAVVVEVGGGLALLAGYKTRWVSWALALFTVVAGVFFHAFWN